MLVGRDPVTITPQIGTCVLDKVKAAHLLRTKMERPEIAARTSYQTHLPLGRVSILSAIVREVHLTRWASRSTIRMTTGSLDLAIINPISPP